MTLEKLFAVAGRNEADAIAEMAAHPDLATAIDVAGDYHEGRAAPAVVHAAARGMRGVLEAMLDLGADIGARGLGGGTALHIAAWMGHRETVQLLIGRGAAVDAVCEAFGATPLGWAAHGFGPDGCFPKGDHAGVARELLGAGADASIPNAEGKRPEDLVREPAGNEFLGILVGAGGT